MIELYNTALSTCSQKVRLTLAEKGVPFVERAVNLKVNEHLSAWYVELNQNGVVPTLVHDGRAVIDSSVINEYLDDLFPEPPLAPRDPYERARMRAWRQYIDEVPTLAIRLPSFNASILPSQGGDVRRWIAERVEKSPLKKAFFSRLGPRGFPQQDIDEALRKLRHTVERMDRSLADGPWLVGEQFTLADLSLIPTIVRMADIDLAHLWRDLPRVADWYARVQRRPSFAEAYYAGSRMGMVRLQQKDTE